MTIIFIGIFNIYLFKAKFGQKRKWEEISKIFHILNLKWEKYIGYLKLIGIFNIYLFKAKFGQKRKWEEISKIFHILNLKWEKYIGYLNY